MTKRAYNRNEEIILSTLVTISGSLSIVGSLAIIWSLLSERKSKRMKSPYHRIMLCMSCLDLFPSIGYVWSTHAFPIETGINGATGSWATCRAQGFLFQLGFGVPIYFYFLTVFYMLTIRCGMGEKDFSRKYEPVMHITCFGFSFGTALAGLFLEIFNPIPDGCWVSDYPADCGRKGSNVDCIYGGRHTNLYRWLFGGAIVVALFVLVPFNMGLIVCAVNKQRQKISRYDRVRSPSVSNSKPNSELGLRAVFRARKIRSKSDKQVKEVAENAAWYVFSYLTVWSWPIIYYLFTMYDEGFEASLPFMILYYFFCPLQGFVNYFVFMRPTAKKIRKDNPDMSFFQAMFVATFHFGSEKETEQSGSKRRVSFKTPFRRPSWGALLPSGMQESSKSEVLTLRRVSNRPSFEASLSRQIQKEIKSELEALPSERIIFSRGIIDLEKNVNDESTIDIQKLKHENDTSKVYDRMNGNTIASISQLDILSTEVETKIILQ